MIDTLVLNRWSSYRSRYDAHAIHGNRAEIIASGAASAFTAREIPPWSPPPTLPHRGHRRCGISICEVSTADVRNLCPPHWLHPRPRPAPTVSPILLSQCAEDGLSARTHRAADAACGAAPGTAVNPRGRDGRPATIPRSGSPAICCRASIPTAHGHGHGNLSQERPPDQHACRPPPRVLICVPRRADRHSSPRRCRVATSESISMRLLLSIAIESRPNTQPTVAKTPTSALASDRLETNVAKKTDPFHISTGDRNPPPDARYKTACRLDAGREICLYRRQE